MIDLTEEEDDKPQHTNKTPPRLYDSNPMGYTSPQIPKVKMGVTHKTKNPKGNK